MGYLIKDEQLTEEPMAKKDPKEADKEEVKQGEVVPRDKMASPFEEMERWFDEALHMPFFAPFRPSRFGFPDFGEPMPSVDIYEDGNDVVVKAEVPGMRKEDIEVKITEDILTISGVKKAEERVEKKDYHRLERSFGSFSRKLRLPSEVEADKAAASFHDGVLEIRIPKTEAAKAKVKKVKIS